MRRQLQGSYTVYFGVVAATAVAAAVEEHLTLVNGSPPPSWATREIRRCHAHPVFSLRNKFKFGSFVSKTDKRTTD